MRSPRDDGCVRQELAQKLGTAMIPSWKTAPDDAARAHWRHARLRDRLAGRGACDSLLVPERPPHRRVGTCRKKTWRLGARRAASGHPYWDRTQKVALADINAAMAQDRVGRCDVEIEVR